MAVPNFIKHLNLEETLSEKELENLRSLVRVEKIAKGTVLQSKGDLKRKSYFVNSGLLRSYTIDEKGKEHIFMFAPENWIISDLEVTDDGECANLYIDSIEDCEIEVIDTKAINGLHGDLRLKHSATFAVESERLFKRIAVLQKRVLMLLSATAIERYEEFVKTYPSIIQRVPQKMIASYLGVTPEALSKLKGQLLKKK